MSEVTILHPDGTTAPVPGGIIPPDAPVGSIVTYPGNRQIIKNEFCVWDNVASAAPIMIDMSAYRTAEDQDLIDQQQSQALAQVTASSRNALAAAGNAASAAANAIAAANLRIPIAEKAKPNGVATLGADGKVLPEQLIGSGIHAKLDANARAVDSERLSGLLATHEAVENTISARDEDGNTFFNEVNADILRSLHTATNRDSDVFFFTSGTDDPGAIRMNTKTGVLNSLGLSELVSESSGSSSSVISDIRLGASSTTRMFGGIWSHSTTAVSGPEQETTTTNHWRPLQKKVGDSWVTIGAA